MLSAARNGDPAACAVVAETVDYLSIAVANLACILNPDRIIISGEMAEFGDLFIEPIRSRLEGLLPAIPDIVLSELKTDAAILGAVATALRQTSDALFVQSPAPETAPLLPELFPNGALERTYYVQPTRDCCGERPQNFRERTWPRACPGRVQHDCQRSGVRIDRRTERLRQEHVALGHGLSVAADLRQHQDQRRGDHRPAAEVGMVFQSANLLPWRNLMKNIHFPMEIFKEDPKKYQARIDELIQLTALKGFERHFPRELSGGMQQRASIVRALSYDPEVLLMDEPFGALDAFTRDEMNVMLLDIWAKKHKTIVFVTHQIPEAVFLSDRVYVMTPGLARTPRSSTIRPAAARPLEVTTEAHFFEIVGRIKSTIYGDVDQATNTGKYEIDRFAHWAAASTGVHCRR